MKGHVFTFTAAEVRALREAAGHRLAGDGTYDDQALGQALGKLARPPTMKRILALTPFETRQVRSALSIAVESDSAVEECGDTAASRAVLAALERVIKAIDAGLD